MIYILSLIGVAAAGYYQVPIPIAAPAFLIVISFDEKISNILKLLKEK